MGVVGMGFETLDTLTMGIFVTACFLTVCAVAYVICDCCNGRYYNFDDHDLW